MAKGESLGLGRGECHRNDTGCEQNHGFHGGLRVRFSQGVQRGAGTIVLLAINAADNTTASAIDLHLDFRAETPAPLGLTGRR